MTNACALLRIPTASAMGLITAILALALAAPAVLALPEDREQPIHISADRALRDESKGVTVYSGSVLMRQGSMELEAERITFYHSSERADQIVAQGSPAKMRQQPEPDKGLVHAEAEVIQYFRQQQRVHLQSNASIEQDGALVTGDSIDYFIDRQLVKAKANADEEGDKVFVVIPPDLQAEVSSSDSSNSPGEDTGASGATHSQ